MNASRNVGRRRTGLFLPMASVNSPAFAETVSVLPVSEGPRVSWAETGQSWAFTNRRELLIYGADSCLYELSQPPRNPSRCRPVLIYGQSRIIFQIRPDWKFSIISMIGP